MSVTDLTRSPAQLVALADGLGRLPAGARGGAAPAAGLAVELERLREGVTDVTLAENDAETAEAFGRGVEPARARLTAARSAFGDAAKALGVRAAALPAAGELQPRVAALKDIPVSGPTGDAWAADARARIDAAQVAVNGFQTDADSKLYATNLQVKAVCDELAKLSRWSLVEHALLRNDSGLVARIAGADIPVSAYVFADTVSPVDLRAFMGQATLGLAPDGVASSVAGAVPAALEHTGRQPVRAVVLLSDGRQVGADASIVSGLAPAGVPVFAVGVAPGEKPRDIAIAQDVSVPASAFVGETVTVRASVLATGQPAGATEIQLRADDAVEARHVELKADGTPAQVEFALRLEQGGARRITLSVPPAAGEITAENNVVERWIKVLPERMKVAAFTATPGWDFQLLRAKLARTPWVRLEAATLDPASPKLPLTPDQILRQDVIVLSDVPVDALDDVQWDAVNRLVRERGGSLFLLAGPQHLPSSYTPASIVASALLPYDVRSVSPSWRMWPGEQAAFRFSPATNIGGEQAESLRVGAGGGSLRNWQAMPGAFRVLPIPELSQRDGAHALLVEADSRTAILTESFPGNGRVFFFGANETWRWRHKVGGRDFDRFWLQLLRHAVGEPYAVQRDLLALDVDKVAISPGESVTVRARILEGDARQFRIDVLRAGQVVQSHHLADGGSRGGRFTAMVSGLSEGEHLIRLSNPFDDNPESPVLEVPIQVAPRSEAEIADVTCDNALLRRLAEASGGQFLPLERLGELPGMLASSGANRSRDYEVSLWDNPLLFVFVVACFGAEWALRKRLGLA
jgi:hypothetical protein